MRGVWRGGRGKDGGLDQGRGRDGNVWGEGKWLAEGQRLGRWGHEGR